jgi:prepilin-type N-terminal cleavage/methylation domain-containing protein
MRSAVDNRGFTLIELVIVIIITGILAAVAVKQMSASIETANYEQTKRELDELAKAIVGNPDVYAEGARTDFGYVGDIGALPPNLDALVTNPGGYTTWDGPYIEGGISASDFKQDAWKTPYLFVDTLIRSTGSGADIDKVFSGSRSELLANTVRGCFRNADGSVPGVSYRDSVDICFTYPNGIGAYTTATLHPSAEGNFAFTNVPIGNHRLEVIYIPAADTTVYPVCVMPGRVTSLDITSPADLW